MNYYIDCEFNSFLGELISIALVPEDDTKQPFYVQFDITGSIHPWVAKHVIHNIGNAPKMSREAAARSLVSYFNNEDITIIADWPQDLTHLMQLLILGPGMMVPINQMTLRYINFPKFNTADFSAIPHNALEDAKALRFYAMNMA